MIQLVSKELTDSTEQRLNELQAEVNTEVSFAAKVSKAKSKWNGKNSSNAGEKAFNEVYDTLKTMCVSDGACNYCENDEGGDIEHIAPKSFFPEQAFVWDNYLLACKTCNTGYKLDKCWVLDSAGKKHETKRGVKPNHVTHAFINPRVENPNQYMLLNLESFTYDLSPLVEDADLVSKNKVECTLAILKLNERELLIQARKNAAIYFYERMHRLSKIVQVESHNELSPLLTPYDSVQEEKDLDNIKEYYKKSFKNDIQKHQHPSVWYAIKKVARLTDSKWEALFQAVPEALYW